MFNQSAIQLRVITLLASSLIFAACGGGGGSNSGGAGGQTERGINEGSFSEKDFNYVNTHPVGYNPTGTDGYQVLSREELFVSAPDYLGNNKLHKLQDDPDTNYAEIAEVNGLFESQGNVKSAAAGQLDRDPASELVVATVTNGGTGLTIHLVNRLASGQYARTPIQNITAGAWRFAGVRVTLGDVDHDYRDEIIVVARSAPFGESANNGQVWVLDDPEAGGSQMLSYVRNGRHINLFGLPLNADDDQRQEVAIGLSGDSTNEGRYALRLYDLAEGEQTMTQVHGWQYLEHGSNQSDSRTVVGDFDRDGDDDLAWVGYDGQDIISTKDIFTIKLFEFEKDNKAWKMFAQYQIKNSFFLNTGNNEALKPGNWAVTSFHPEIRQADLALVYPEREGSFYKTDKYKYMTLHFDRTQNKWSNRTVTINYDYSYNPGITLAATDVNADGAEEVQLGILRYIGSTGSLHLAYLEHEDTGINQIWQSPISLGAGSVSSYGTPVPVLAPGDYDADGFALQYTGVHSTKVGDPIPLVVMSAPPTVAGISQNVDDTESAYETGNTESKSIGVSTYSSITASTDTSVKLFGALSVSGRASIERGIEHTETTTKSETFVQGYRGAYDDDVIVFQGTLYETYEYLIVSADDPALIGKRITIDIPVDSNIYKWTVDYYNQRVEPDDQIGRDLLTHTPGDPETYPTRSELAILMQDEMHWDLPGVHAVGQGGASNYQSVSFATEQATEDQRSVTKSFGAGVSFGVAVSIDKANTQGATHGISYAEQTTFEATVGDIDDPDDYDNWRYNWGFSIHTVGRLADSTNQPAGYTSRKHSFEYLRYWAEPTGTGY